MKINFFAKWDLMENTFLHWPFCIFILPISAFALLKEYAVYICLYFKEHLFLIYKYLAEMLKNVKNEF